MLWSQLHPADQEPLEEQINTFVDTPLWDDLAQHLQQTYCIQPKLSYSNCAMDKGEWKGWNVKYKKSGKALCTLYPKQGYFVLLLVVGEKQSPEADLLIPACDAYTQELYNKTPFVMGGKWLAMEVTNENILRDAKNFIALRVNPKP
ncbi:MAG: DUF3788 domain-containing protein [Clostridiales bacterium]|nr:DUF3788 domain-containing protein [Clostridiales bacterium]